VTGLARYSAPHEITVMSAPIQLFHHCPRCGGKITPAPDANQIHCPACGLAYYFNPAVAVAALIRNDRDEILFIRRAKDPAKGKLAAPGGFVDYGETAEEALRREVREEVNLELDSTSYLASYANQYHYKDVTYPVLDFYFTATAKSFDNLAALDEVAGLHWARADAVDMEEIAFPTLRKTLEILRTRD
jgi:mutator protein MutT